MMKLIKLLTYIFLANFFFINSVYAATITGTPTKYEVTMKKMELCESSGCSIATLLAEKDGTFNIASVSAGADIGSWISGFALVVGETYSHVRATISVDFTIAGYITDDNSNGISEDYCVTVASPATAASATSWAITSTGSNATTNADMAWVVPNATGGTYGNLTSSFKTNGISKINGASTFSWIGALTSSYTATTSSSPKITMSFDVTGQLQAQGDGSVGCIIYVKPPVVSISLTD